MSQLEIGLSIRAPTNLPLDHRNPIQSEMSLSYVRSLSQSLFLGHTITPPVSPISDSLLHNPLLSSFYTLWLDWKLLARWTLAMVSLVLHTTCWCNCESLGKTPKVLLENLTSWVSSRKKSTRWLRALPWKWRVCQTYVYLQRTRMKSSPRWRVNSLQTTDLSTCSASCTCAQMKKTQISSTQQ